MTDLNVAIIGCGLIALEKHIPAFKRIENATLSSVCDLDTDLAEETADEFDIPSSYSDISVLLGEEDIDIVDICIPPHVHEEAALESIDHNCHVILEKPMELSTDACNRMIEQADERGVKLSTVHTDLFHPPFLKARKMISRGEIGDVLAVRMNLATGREHMLERADHWYHDLPGGMIGETGPHVSYMTLEFVDDIRDVGVYATKNTDFDYAPHDEFKFVVEGERVISSATLSYSGDYWAADIDILGTEAALRIDLHSMSLIVDALPDLEPIQIGINTVHRLGQHVKSLSTNTAKVALGSQRMAPEIILRRFVESVRTDTDPPVTPREARETVGLVESIVSEYERKYDI